MKTITINLLRKAWILFSMVLLFSYAANASIKNVTAVENDSNILKVLLDTANLKQGDTIMIDEGTYVEPAALRIYKTVTIMAKPGLVSKPFVHLKNSKISMYKEKISLIVKGLSFSGLRDDLTQPDNFFAVDGPNVGTNVADTFGIIKFQDCAIREYNRVFHLAVKGTFSCDSLIIDNITMYNKIGTNFVFTFGDKAYPKYFGLTNSTFYNIQGGIIDNPRNAQTATPGYTPKMKMVVDHNTFHRIVSNHRSFIQTEKMISKANTNPDSLTIIISNNIIDSLKTPAFITTGQNYCTPFKNFNFQTRTMSLANISFINNCVYNFNATHDSAANFNLAGFIAAPNVYDDKILTTNPLFEDTSLIDGDGYDFTLPDSSDLYVASTTGGAIGDPDWAPLATSKIVTISPLTSKLIEGNNVQLEVLVNLQGSVDKTVTWSVANNYGGTTGTATIDSASGLLSATAIGQVKVTATSNLNNAFYDTLIVTIEAKTLVTSISLSATNASGNPSTSINNKSGFLDVSASIIPGNADDKSLIWSVSGTGGVTLTVKSSSSCQIIATKSGSVTVKATANDGSNVFGTLDVTITGQVPVTGVTVTSEGNATTISVKGGTLQMIATVEPDTADDKTVIWSVNNTSIATISETSGLLTAVADGKVIVKATTNDHGRVDTMAITIENQSIGIDNLTTQNISVLPNPATDHITIYSDKATSVAIYNIVGKMVLYKNTDANGSIDIQNLESGIYYVKVNLSDQVKTVKLIKK